jgi:peptidoglycan hydrolase-like protein with peptidoglycan-binding domain
VAKLLKLGDSGSEVKKLQTALNDAGAKPKVKTDGKFDSTTEEAVKAFQKQNKLKVDGRAGKDTLSTLANNGANPNEEKEELKRLETILDNLRNARDECEKGFTEMEKELEREYKKAMKTGKTVDIIAKVVIIAKFAQEAVKDTVKGSAAMAMKSAIVKLAPVTICQEVLGLDFMRPSYWADWGLKSARTGIDNETAYNNWHDNIVKEKTRALTKLDLKIREFEKLVKEAKGKK